MTLGILQIHADRRRNGSQGDARAGDQRLEQHVARAGLHAAAAGGGVQPGFDQRLAGLDAAGDASPMRP
jgi:hypothetical protein